MIDMLHVFVLIDKWERPAEVFAVSHEMVNDRSQEEMERILGQLLYPYARQWAERYKPNNGPHAPDKPSDI